jgi:multidrug resistance efflux pump
MRTAGKIAVPRRMVTVALLVGALLTGVAAIKAAETIKDSWRKKLEVARVETDVIVKKARLEATREMAARAERQVSQGLVPPEEYQALKLGAEKADLDLKRSLLNLDEVNASGVVARDELSAPLVDGRDFVTDRLKVEKRQTELDGELLGTHLKRYQQLLEKGMVPEAEVDRMKAERTALTSVVDKIQERIELRKRFAAGEITVLEVEIRDRITVAERSLRLAQSRVEGLQEQLKRLQALEAKGMVSPTEVKMLQYGLEAAQAELELAALEKKILENIKGPN